VSSTGRGERTRQLIVERTAPVFDAQGFAAASLAQLVASTGLTRGAFYFHFESKDALAIAIAEAQEERWELLRGEVERDEPEPLRRLVTLNLRAAARYQRDFVLRAAARLLAERTLIRGSLPATAPWWVSTVMSDLTEAAAAGELRDLSGLIRPGSATSTTPEAGLRTLAEHLVAVWAALPAAAGEFGADDLADRIYTTWAVLLPRICSRPGQIEELLALVATLGTEVTVAASDSEDADERTSGADQPPE
jgi:AcrR family transcriptional regulator